MELYSQRISDSIDDLKKKNFSEAFESLYQIRNDIIKIGGSNAQVRFYCFRNELQCI